MPTISGCSLICSYSLRCTGKYLICTIKAHYAMIVASQKGKKQTIYSSIALIFLTINHFQKFVIMTALQTHVPGHGFTPATAHLHTCDHRFHCYGNTKAIPVRKPQAVKSPVSFHICNSYIFNHTSSLCGRDSFFEYKLE